MAQVLVTFSKAMGQGSEGARHAIPVLSAQNITSAELTSSGTSSATSVTSSEGDVCRIVNNGTTLVWVTFGAAPTAAVATGYAIPGGATLEVGPFPSGWKVGVIDDS